jgi:hypothetical protein
MPSTSLRDLTYDAGHQTLEVTFISSGRRYRYFDVAPEEYEALRHAFSKGSHFNRHIKPNHRFDSPKRLNQAGERNATPAGTERGQKMMPVVTSRVSGPTSATVAKSTRSA